MFRQRSTPSRVSHFAFLCVQGVVAHGWQCSQAVHTWNLKLRQDLVEVTESVVLETKTWEAQVCFWHTDWRFGCGSIRQFSRNWMVYQMVLGTGTSHPPIERPVAWDALAGSGSKTDPHRLGSLPSITPPICLEANDLIVGRLMYHGSRIFTSFPSFFHIFGLWLIITGSTSENHVYWHKFAQVSGVCSWFLDRDCKRQWKVKFITHKFSDDFQKQWLQSDNLKVLNIWKMCQRFLQQRGLRASTKFKGSSKCCQNFQDINCCLEKLWNYSEQEHFEDQQNW